MNTSASRNKSGVNPAKFFAEEYGSARPLYPPRVFDLLLRDLGRDGTVHRFLDLGCGSGQSSRSFLDLGIGAHGFAIDPDPAMLEVARTALASYPARIDWIHGNAECIPLPAVSTDLVFVGSAIHWFDLVRTEPELRRVMLPGSRFFVFEYQFPVPVRDTELGEKIRRRFNLEWKAPNQRPRGRLLDVLAPFRDRNGWRYVGSERPEWKVELSLDAFLRHIFSQSRYLHAEAAQARPADYRASIRAEIAPYFAGGPLLCDFRPRTFLFRSPEG